jgi:hypothetical protein
VGGELWLVAAASKFRNHARHCQHALITIVGELDKAWLPNQCLVLGDRATHTWDCASCTPHKVISTHAHVCIFTKKLIFVTCEDNFAGVCELSPKGALS